MIKLLPEVDTPEKLNKFLNTFDYAKGMDVSVYAKLYKFPTEAEFIRDKGGICWDYANYEMYYLKLLGFKPRFFYIEDVSNEVDIINHTFVIFPDGYNFKWIESSWNGNKGIFSYFSLNEALVDITRRFMGTKTPNEEDYLILERKNYNHPPYETTNAGYFRWIYKTSSFVKGNKKSYLDYLKVYKVKGRR